MAGATRSEEYTALTMPLDRRLGVRTARALAKIGLATTEDLLYYTPYRIAPRGQLMPLARVQEGEDVTLVGRVLNAHMRPMNARRGFILNVTVGEGSHELDLAFFSKSPRPLEYHQRRLEVGQLAIFSGKVSEYRGRLQLTHPDYEPLDATAQADTSALRRPIPIYHATASLPSWKIEKAAHAVLASLNEDEVGDPLPREYRQAHGLPTLYEALTSLHMPHDQHEFDRAWERMAHQEAFVLQAYLAREKSERQASPARAYPPAAGGILGRFDAALPFDFTASQRRVGAEISHELAGTVPMQRLLQGDVGSGKTLVALRAMLQVVDAGGQAALLVPTEVLAWQHYQTFLAMLGPLATPLATTGAEVAGVGVEFLSASLSAPERRRVLARMASGQAGIVIGTHALLSENVQLPFLGLVVVDEQHRFGVEQRAALTRGVHTLVMTATPIPRTIAISAFGDLDLSTLTERPAGRGEVRTVLVPEGNPAWYERVWERIGEEVAAGGRAYVVCPRIVANPEDTQANATGTAQSSTAHSRAALDAESDTLIFESTQPSSPSPRGDLHSVEEIAAMLQVRYPGNVAIMHGKMSGEEKSRAMASFAQGDTPILVATTVIEVGVDVPEATAMVILDADFFGLAQLHQLRGRIGRGKRQGICLAVSRKPIGEQENPRLAAFASTNDGFALAQADLNLRGVGNILGAQQSGHHSLLRYLDLARHSAIIDQARRGAYDVIARDPHLEGEPALAQALTNYAQQAEYLEKA